MNLIKCFFVIAFAFAINAEVVANTRKVLSAAGLAVNEDLKVEFGEGIGETKDEALKEAIRDVLQRVVGTYVDSDFRVENDNIIKDQIITHSNGFIEHYKIIEVANSPNDRGVQLTIKAWVKIRDFVERMKGVSAAQRVAVDGVLLENELENKYSAERLIENEFESLDPVNNLLKVELVSNIKPLVQESSDEQITLRYIFRIQYSSNYYKKFLPRFCRVMDQISSHPPRDIVTRMALASIKSYPRQNDIDTFKDATVSGTALMYHVPGKEKNSVRAVVKINRGGVVTLREWYLTTRQKKVFMRCREEAFSWRGSVNCVLRLLDVNNSIVAEGVTDVGRDCLFMCVSTYPDGIGDCCFELVPAMPKNLVMELTRESEDAISAACRKARFYRYGTILSGYVGYIDVVIDRKDVCQIKTAEIKMEQKK